jgi:hypothetical protein
VALPEAAFGLPITIVVLRPFMRSILAELEDAALVDGATKIRFFVQILLPLSRPALATVAVLAFVTSWNQYLLPLLVFTGTEHFTLPLAVANFQTRYAQDTATSWPSRPCRWCPPWAASCSRSGIWSAASPAPSRLDGARIRLSCAAGRRGPGDDDDDR